MTALRPITQEEYATIRDTARTMLWNGADPDSLADAIRDEYNALERLEELRKAIRAENISYGEIAELQDLREHIAPDDAELLEWAGVSEDDYRKGLQ